MSLVAIKGIYENGHIVLEEQVNTQQAVAVIVTFLDKPVEMPTVLDEWQHWFASFSEFSDDFMMEGRGQLDIQERDWSVFE